MGFISKLILPRQVDFDRALQQQAHQASQLIQDLYDVYVAADSAAAGTMRSDAEEIRSLKNRNMRELLNVFITPYDKESIFRLITQLEWVALSAHHLKILANAHAIDSMKKDEDILNELKYMATLLDEGISQLSSGTLGPIAAHCDRIHDKYNQVVSLCARSMASQLRKDDFRKAISSRDILAQLREIAKRIHIAANTLEDMMIKLS